MNEGPWWVEPAATLIGIVVGAWIIMWQQRAGHRAEIKRKLFEELRSSLGSANDAVHEAGGYVFGIPTHVNLARDAQKLGKPGRTPPQRFHKMLELQRAGVDKTAELMTVLKGHLIVSRHFELFHQALACAMRDAIELEQRLYPVVAHMIPFDSQADGSLPYPTYSDEQAVELGRRATAYWESMMTLSNYIEDILTEAQNLLLDDTFDGRVAPRQPADSRYWVLRTDDPAYLEKLRKFFFIEHPAAVSFHGHGVAAAAEALRAIHQKGKGSGPEGPGPS